MEDALRLKGYKSEKRQTEKQENKT